MERILIIKPSSLGDIVHTLPLVHCLKRCLPDCFIGWIVQDAFAGLLERDPAVDMIYPVTVVSTSDPQAGKNAYTKAGLQLLSTLRKLRNIYRDQSYDTVFDLHGSLKSGLLALTNPGGKRIGFAGARELNPLFQHQTIPVPRHIEHALDKNSCFARYFKCQVDQSDYHMCCSDEDRRIVASFVRENGINSDDQIIYANPAARWRTKFWPAERWAELADNCRQQGQVMIFGGSAHDTAYIATITGTMTTEPVVAAGLLSLSQSVALIQRSALYVGLDSGPMHMAALSGIPVVALFGPTHPSRVGPYGVKHRIVRDENLDCLECRKRQCDHLSCMRGISVRMVEDALSSLITCQEHVEN